MNTPCDFQYFNPSLTTNTDLIPVRERSGGISAFPCSPLIPPTLIEHLVCARHCVGTGYTVVTKAQPQPSGAFSLLDKARFGSLMCLEVYGNRAIRDTPMRAPFHLCPLVMPLKA